MCGDFPRSQFRADLQEQTFPLDCRLLVRTGAKTGFYNLRTPMSRLRICVNEAPA